jgi:hypothetical protein
VLILIAANECGEADMKNTLKPYQSQQVTYLIRICCYDPLTTDLIFKRAICEKLGVAGSKMTLIIGKSSVTGSC